MRWLAPSTWLLLLGTATLSANCVIPARTTVCSASEGASELFTDTTCNICASQACCDEAVDCANDAACSEAVTCFEGCADGGNAACFARCRTRAGASQALLGRVVDCLGARCDKQHDCTFAEEVPSPCESAGRVAEALGANCAACVRRSLCEEATACADDPACAARLTCMAERCQGAPTSTREGLHPGCFDACTAGADTYYEGDRIFLSKVAGFCPVECRVGREFSCISAFRWPEAASNSISIERRVQDRTAGGLTPGFEGIRVTACNPGPLGGCDDDAPTAVSSGEQGLVTLEEVPTGLGFGTAAGFQGYYVLEAEPTSPAVEVWRRTILHHLRPEWRTRRADEPDPYAPDTLLRVILDGVAASAEVELLLDLTNGRESESRGLLVGGMVDCRGRSEFFAPGMILEIEGTDDQTIIRYVNDNQIGIASNATSTTSSGQFIAINVPPGETTARMVDEATGEVFAESNDINVAADALTVVQFYPRQKSTTDN